jgi:hypothetical protein
MTIWQLFFGNYRTADTFFYQAMQKLQQTFVLDPIYRLIPENDAERYIWRYKFYQYIYARSFWAPVTDEDKKAGRKFNSPAASFEPELIPILLDIYNSIIKLDTLPIEDEEFSKIYRYITMANMFQYYWMYYQQQVNLKFQDWLPYEDENNKARIFYTTPKYREQYLKYIDAINHTKEAMDEDERLWQKFESMPHAKAGLYMAATVTYYREFEKLYLHDIYPCGTYEMRQYAKYLNDFLEWSYSPYSSYAKLGRKIKFQYRLFADKYGGKYIARNVCGERVAYMGEEPTAHHMEQYSPTTQGIRALENKTNTTEGEKDGR